MSVEAMRSAVVAIRAGVFDGVPGVPETAPRASATSPDMAPWSAVDLGASAVVVLAGHSGAGATTVALAVAESLSGRRRVQLVESADPSRSGLAAASSSELGLDEVGWRRGRRGKIDLARPAVADPSVEHRTILPPGVVAPAVDRLVVLDAGWRLASALIGSGPATLGSAQIVVVTRVTVSGIRQTEHVLEALGVPAVLATVGPGRWPGMVAGSRGPALRATQAAGRAVRVPIDRRLEMTGVTADPLPKRVAAAGRALAELLLQGQSALAEPSSGSARKGADVAAYAR
jgi:hypothetical protein